MNNSSKLILDHQVYTQKIDNQYIELILQNQRFVMDYDTLMETLFALVKISRELELDSAIESSSSSH